MTTNREVTTRRLMLFFVWFCSALSVVALVAIVYLKITGRWHSF